METTTGSPTSRDDNQMSPLTDDEGRIGPDATLEHSPTEQAPSVIAQNGLVPANVSQHTTDNFTCQVKRCRTRREHHGNAGSRFLFSTEWRQMKIGNLSVWVVDIATRCPDCLTLQSYTLIPPGLEPRSLSAD